MKVNSIDCHSKMTNADIMIKVSRKHFISCQIVHRSTLSTVHKSAHIFDHNQLKICKNGITILFKKRSYLLCNMQKCVIKIKKL